jgi:predicted SAM-dependent methyltransferase
VVVKLHWGCGNIYKSGWINLDRNINSKADHIRDITDVPWMLNGAFILDGSVDEIIADNLLEHIGWKPDGSDLLMAVMNEAWRVTSPDGSFWFRVPDAEKCPWGAFRDPTHRRYFVSGSFDYWKHNHGTYKNYGSAYGYKPWSVEVKAWTNPSNNLSFLDVTQSPIK